MSQEENKKQSQPLSSRPKLHHMMGTPGRPRRFKESDELWKSFCDYCDWVDENPWQKKSAANRLSENAKGEKSNSVGQNVAVMQRAYKLYEFCAFAGIPKWADFKASYLPIDGFSEVISAIENVVISQQLDGALLHQFDSNLVARLNGIADKQISEVSGPNGGTLPIPKLTDKDFERLKEINETIGGTDTSA
jgi:hypothetical protein